MSQSRRLQILFFAVLYLGLSDLVHADERERGDNPANNPGAAQVTTETVAGGGSNTQVVRRPHVQVTHEQVWGGGQIQQGGGHMPTPLPPIEDCLTPVDPPSLSCQQAIFQGSFYPILEQSKTRIQGTWRPLYFNSVDASMDFRTALEPRLQFGSLGVLNQEDGSRLGDLIVDGTSTRFMNWRSERNVLMLIPESFGPIDAHTYEFKMSDIGADQGFQCRIYVDRSTEMLLCRWLENREGQYVLRGFFGFQRPMAATRVIDRRTAITPQRFPIGW